MKSAKNTFLFVSVVFSLSACGGGGSGAGSSGLEARTESFDTSVLQGLWDASETDEDGEDVLYRDFSADGNVDEYDYDQDVYGDGENCHYKSSYQVQNHGNGVYEYLTVFPTKVHLTVRGDFMDKREQADGPIVFTYERVSGISTVDLAICE